MNKLKISLALIALIIPLLLCAKKRNIEFIKHGNHRIPVESFIPVKAFFDDCNKELTIEFAQDWEAVTIEIKSKEGYVVYRNLYIPHSNSSLSTSLENIPAGIYELTITDEKGILAGEFIIRKLKSNIMKKKKSTLLIVGMSFLLSIGTLMFSSCADKDDPSPILPTPEDTSYILKLKFF